MTDLGFTPTSPAPAAAPTNDLGFVPNNSSAAAAPAAASGGGFGQFALNVGKGALNFVDNNPISHALTSLSAMPVQGLAKLMGQPDPYANSAMGATSATPGINVTSSDQPLGKYAEEQAGNALTAGSLLIPAGEIASGVSSAAPVLGRFAGPLARIGTQAAIGAAQGAGGSMQSGGSFQDILGGAKVGTALGGGLATAGELGSALLDNAAQTTGASRLESHVKSGGAAKTLTNAFNAASTKSTDPITTMQQSGLIKDLRVVDGKINVEGLTNPSRTGSLDGLIEDQQQAGSAAVQSMKGGVSLSAFKNQVTQAIKDNPAIQASGGVSKALGEVETRFDDYAKSYGDNISYKQVDQVRKAMNRVWNPDSWDAEKAIGNAARSVLYQGAAAPGALTNEQIGTARALQSAMKNEQELLNTQEFVQKLGGTAVKGGRLGKYIADATGAGVGMAAGAPIPYVGPALGAAVGGYATDKVVNAMQAGYFNPAAGRMARSLAPFVPAASTAKTIGQGMLIPGVTGGGQ